MFPESSKINKFAEISELRDEIKKMPACKCVTCQISCLFQSVEGRQVDEVVQSKLYNIHSGLEINQYFWMKFN